VDFATIKEAWSIIAMTMSVSEKINTAWIDSMVEVSSPVSVREGDTIISLGDQNTDKGYLLISGEYSVEKEGAPELVKPAPELLGEMGRLNPTQKRTATVRASTNVEMLTFSWGQMNAALEKRLSESEFQQLTEGLQQYAWGHFAE
jgi:CRP-like cAMP-binding protein